MANGLNPQQQTQLQGILRTQFNLGQNNAQNFVNNGNQGLLGNLASQSNLTNSGSSSGVTYYYPLTYEYGPRTSECTPESTTRDNDTPTITGSNGGTYTVCIT